MATKFPPPSPLFIKARHFGGRQTPKAIVMHGTVSSDNRGTARNIANWWAGPTSPVTSAHYTVDPGEVIQSVGDHSVAFHCGSNQDCIGVELCDEQTGPVTRWRDADSQAIIRRAARLVAELCLAYGIEARRPTIAELKAKGKHGIYGHNDSRLAFGNTSHTDPRDFPWDEFLRLVRGEIAKIRAAAEPAAPAPRVTNLRVMHASMQAGDDAAQSQEDVDRLFARAVRRNVAWITGTEADAELRAILRTNAGPNGYRLHIWREEWIAVRNSLVHANWRPGSVPVLESTEGLGRHSDRGLATVSFVNRELGRINIAAAHLLTRGRKPGEPNYVFNQRMTRAIGSWGREAGRGSALAFYAGDQNNIDREVDTFHGQPFTSAWDELGKWQSTGHGNIDVIASWDADGRVKATFARALSDERFPLNTDHFLIEAGFEIRHL